MKDLRDLNDVTIHDVKAHTRAHTKRNRWGCSRSFSGPITPNAKKASGCRFQGSGFRVQDLGFRVQGSGFRVRDSGFRAQG